MGECMDPVYALQGIHKEFRSTQGTLVAKGCDDIHLHIERGSFLAITGESGSGKSTLLSLLGFLAAPSPAPRPGAFLFADGSGRHDVAAALRQGIGSKTLSHWRANHIGFVFQNYHLLNHLTGRANVELGARFAAKKVGRRSTPDEVLATLGMLGLARKKTRDLSGGQKQRISVARALVKRPEVLLADEPTGNLDTANKCLVLASLVLANRRLGATVVLVTHELEHPPRVADRILTMRDGRIADDRTSSPRVRLQPDDSVRSLAERIAADCYPDVMQDLKWE
jgi:putative ABC transport system ATP-binding protein